MKHALLDHLFYRRHSLASSRSWSYISPSTLKDVRAAVFQIGEPLAKK